MSMDTVSLTSASKETSPASAERAGRSPGSGFRREIVIVLLIKLALILTIKFVFFSHPASLNTVEAGLDAAFSSQPVPVPQSSDKEKERP